MPRGSRGPEVVTIYWRDIPAQVNGQSGRDRHQVPLPARFQRAVDRAKRKAGIYTAEEDIGQWRRTSEACDDHVAAAEARARALEADFTSEYLGRLAFAGGFSADIDVDAHIDRTELRALEELQASDVLDDQEAPS